MDWWVRVGPLRKIEELEDTYHHKIKEMAKIMSETEILCKIMNILVLKMNCFVF